MNLKKLNGWQRLWVVVSVLWLLFVVGVSIVGDVIPTADGLEARLGRNTRNLQREWALATIEAARVAISMSGQTTAGRIRASYDELTDVETVERLHNRFPEIDFEPVDSDYQEKLDGEQTRHQERLDALRVEQAKHIGLISLGWFAAPSVGLYLFGWAVAWVRRGFKLKRDR